MYKRAGPVLLLLLLTLLVPASLRATILDFSIPSASHGSIGYAGGAAPLVGSNITANSVTLEVPAGPTYNLIGGLLAFTTGGYTGHDANRWYFAGGGSLTVKATCIDSDNDGAPCDASDTYASGVLGKNTFELGSFDNLTGATVSRQGQIFNVAIGLVNDQKDDNLLALFGIEPAESWQGVLNIQFSIHGAPHPGDAFTSFQTYAGDLSNQAPEPAIPVLMGMSLFGVGLLGKAKVLA